MDALQDRLASVPNQEWYLEIVGAALERTDDLDKSMRMADEVIEKHPWPPVSDEDQMLHGVLDALVEPQPGPVEKAFAETFEVAINRKTVVHTKAAPKHPYTEVCPRDGGGHCLPKGQASQTKPKSGVPVKPSARRAELFAAKRVGEGKKAKLKMADGGKPPAHLPAAKIPPAWTNLMVARDPDSDVLATGLDAKGRRQTLYAETYVMKTAAVKFSRVKELLEKYDSIVSQNAINRSSKDQRTRDAADCLALIIAHGFRPGSEKDTKGSTKAYGATTLRSYHVVQSGADVWLRFTGKKGVPQSHKITNPALAKMLLERKKKADAARGQLFATSAADLVAYVHKLDGGGFITKDLRTAKACRMAIDAVNEIKRKPKTEKDYKRKVKEICTSISRVLGNNPSQVFKSYVSPEIWTAIKPE